MATSGYIWDTINKLIIIRKIWSKGSKVYGKELEEVYLTKVLSKTNGFRVATQILECIKYLRLNTLGDSQMTAFQIEIDRYYLE